MSYSMFLSAKLCFLSNFCPHLHMQYMHSGKKVDFGKNATDIRQDKYKDQLASIKWNFEIIIRQMIWGILLTTIDICVYFQAYYSIVFNIIFCLLCSYHVKVHIIFIVHSTKWLWNTLDNTRGTQILDVYIIHCSGSIL